MFKISFIISYQDFLKFKCPAHYAKYIFSPDFLNKKEFIIFTLYMSKYNATNNKLI